METKNQEEVMLETVEMTEDVLRGEALERLRKNPDFKFLIEETYIKQKSIDLTSLLANNAIKQRGERPEVVEQLVAISNFNDWLLQVEHFYQAATSDDGLLDDAEQE